MLAGLATLLSAVPGPVAAGDPPLEARRIAFEAGTGAAQPSVAVDPRARFVLTWQERRAEEASLWFALFDRDGREQRRGRIAAGRSWFVNWADFPSLVVLDNGDWVTYHLEKSAAAPYAYDIRLLRSTDLGRSWSAPVTPHDDGTPTQHGFVSLVPAGEDRVLVVWLDGRRAAAQAAKDGAAHAGHDEDAPMTLRSAVLDRRGVRSAEYELDDSTCSCCQTDAGRIAGRTLVAYRDRSAEEIRDIGIVAGNGAGGWSRPRIHHADGWRIEGCPVNGPALAVNGGRVLTVWPTLVGDGFQVRYTSGGADAAGPMRILAAGSGTLGRVDAAAWRSGFLVSWLAGRGAEPGLHLAWIDAGGRVLARRTLSDAPATRLSGNPRIAGFGERALIAWVEPGGVAGESGLALALIGD